MQIVYDSTKNRLKVLSHPKIDTERDRKIARLIHSLPSKTGEKDYTSDAVLTEEIASQIAAQHSGNGLIRRQCMWCYGHGNFGDIPCLVCEGKGYYYPYSAAHKKDIDIIRQESEANERLREKIGRSLGKSDVEVKSDIYRKRKESPKTDLTPRNPYEWEDGLMGRNGK